MNKVFNLLGLATRAGQVITGEDMIIKNIRNKKANLVIISENCGKNTTKKLIDKCNYYSVDYIVKFRIDELSKAIGKENRVSLAITNYGFSKKIKDLIEEGGSIFNEKN